MQNASGDQLGSTPTGADWVGELIEENHRRATSMLRSTEHRRIRCVGIVGAGIMGKAIAAVLVDGGLSVVLHDADSAAIAQADQAVVAELVDAGRRNIEDACRLVDAHYRAATNLDDVAQCDLVLESVSETPAVKHAVYAELEPRLCEHAVLATNTSTIPIERLAAPLKRPERFCGMHFFHPVAHRPLVEIVRHDRTLPSAVAALVGCAESINKRILLVDDGPGFLVNRLLLPYLTEAVELLLDGVPVERLESVAVRFGMAKGPLQLLDEIGLDTTLHGGRVLWEAFGERVVVSPLMIAMYKAGRFGCKTGAGFFDYTKANAMPEGTLPPVDRVAQEKIDHWKREPQRFTEEEIVERLFLPMVLEATRLLEEHKVDRAGDVDLGVIFGLGFPAVRGGLLRWADSFGSGRLLEMLRRLEALGPRAEPTSLLCQMAVENRTFYSDATPDPGGRNLTLGDKTAQ